MPGRRSLAVSQYYAHPRNAFWPILGACLGFSPDLPYVDRLRALGGAGIALWDVLASCERPGSLDADVRLADATSNDFAWLFAQCPRLSHVLCNGALAHEQFVRRVLPTLAATKAPTVHRLPSTSPAHAGVAGSAKLAAWRAALAAAGVRLAASDR
jgi:hypoxanthine-DNA glycosylase